MLLFESTYILKISIYLLVLGEMLLLNMSPLVNSFFLIAKSCYLEIAKLTIHHLNLTWENGDQFHVTINWLSKCHPNGKETVTIPESISSHYRHITFSCSFNFRVSRSVQMQIKVSSGNLNPDWVFLTYLNRHRSCYLGNMENLLYYVTVP